MKNQLPAEFIVTLNSDVSQSIDVATSINVDCIKEALEEKIMKVLGVNGMRLVNAAYFNNHEFSVNTCRVFNPEFVSLSVVMAVVSVAIESGQIDKDTAISVMYNSEEQNFDGVDALSTAIDTIEQRAKHIIVNMPEMIVVNGKTFEMYFNRMPKNKPELDVFKAYCAIYSDAMFTKASQKMLDDISDDISSEADNSFKVNNAEAV